MCSQFNCGGHQAPKTTRWIQVTISKNPAVRSNSVTSRAHPDTAGPFRSGRTGLPEPQQPQLRRTQLCVVLTKMAGERSHRDVLGKAENHGFEKEAEAAFFSSPWCCCFQDVVVGAFDSRVPDLQEGLVLEEVEVSPGGLFRIMHRGCVLHSGHGKLAPRSKSIWMVSSLLAGSK